MTDLSATAAIKEISSRAEITSWLDRFFAGMGQGFNAYTERVGRYDKIRALQAKSDADLAKMGLTRERIPYHVFSDLFYI